MLNDAQSPRSESEAATRWTGSGAIRGPNVRIKNGLIWVVGRRLLVVNMLFGHRQADLAVLKGR